MLEELTNILCPIIMISIGFYIIKKLTNTKIKIITLKNILLIGIYAILAALIRSINYSGINTIITFLMNIIIYKIIFKENISKTIILTSIVMVITFLADMFCGIVLISFFSTKDIRSL